MSESKLKDCFRYTKTQTTFFPLPSNYRSLKSGAYKLRFDSQEIPVCCYMGDFGCGNGGWTTAMKINGRKVYRAGFHSLVAFFSFLSFLFCFVCLFLVLADRMGFVPPLISENLPLRLQLLDQQGNLQRCGMGDWVRYS